MLATKKVKIKLEEKEVENGASKLMPFIGLSRGLLY